MKTICLVQSQFGNSPGPTMEYCEKAAAEEDPSFHPAEITEYRLSPHPDVASDCRLTDREQT